MTVAMSTVVAGTASPATTYRLEIEEVDPEIRGLVLDQLDGIAPSRIIVERVDNLGPTRLALGLPVRVAYNNGLKQGSRN